MDRAAETAPAPWPVVVRGGLAIAVVVALTAGDVWLLCRAPYLRLAYGPLRPAEAVLAGPPAWVAEAAGAAAGYVSGARPREAVTTISDPSSDGPRYSAAELDHLADVRRVIGLLFRLGLAAAVVILLAWVLDVRAGGRRAAAALVRGGQASVALTLVVAILIAVAWNGLFTTFHAVLFPPGTWQFASDSLLIQLFPEWFWQRAAAVLALMLSAEGLAISRLARRTAIGR